MPEILIASTFYKSRGRLESEQVQRIAEFLKQFSREPDDPGFGFQEIRDEGEHAGWLARISQNLAVVIEKLGDRVILLYSATPDEARGWARGHRVRLHPKTGAVQIVPALPPAETGASSGPRQGDFDFSPYDDGYLRALGVPEGWEERIRRICNEADFWAVYERLPGEAAERIYVLALGGTVAIPLPTPPKAPTRRNLDSLRRLVEVPDEGQLPHYLTMPFEKWMLFLHPGQRVFVGKAYNGPVKITGTAGTGKTVVAMHRARHLAKQGHRVLLTTFNRALRRSITQKLDRLCLPEERQRIKVATVCRVALDICQQLKPAFEPTGSKDEEEEVLNRSFVNPIRGFKYEFIVDEWHEVIAKQAIRTWGEYESSSRFGRGTALGPAQRKQLWPLFERCLQELQRRQQLPWGHLARRAGEAVEDGRLRSPYTAVVVDEIQDLSSWEILLAKAMTNDHLENLMLIGDTGQRIYPGGFSLRQMGIEVRGRSHRLTLSYRCSARILRAATKLREDNVDDMDGDKERAGAARPKSWGRPPVLQCCGAENHFTAENAFVFGKIRELLAEGLRPYEIAVLAPKRNIRGAFRHALNEESIQWQPLERHDAEPVEDAVFCDTMHSAKGHEFRAVFLVACRDNAIPLRRVGDGHQQDERELQRDRNLLYVSMTRAREFLYMTWTGTISPLLRPIALQ